MPLIGNYEPSSRVAAPSAGFEPAHMAPEATALSPELRGRVKAHGTSAPISLVAVATVRGRDRGGKYDRRNGDALRVALPTS